MANTKPKSSQVIYGKNSSPTVENALDVLQPALAMAKTFTAVPSTFQSWVIFVTLPHFRTFIWDGVQNKYVRAPWHQPGTLRHVYRDLRPGELEVRSDVTLQSADFPDLAEYLGITGSTFVLDEARAEFIRNADSGRGKDAGRGIGTHQGDAIRQITGVVGFHGSGDSTVLSNATGVFSGVEARNRYRSGGTGVDGAISYGAAEFKASNVVPTAAENRPTNLAYRWAITY